MRNFWLLLSVLLLCMSCQAPTGTRQDSPVESPTISEGGLIEPSAAEIYTLRAGISEAMTPTISLPATPSPCFTLSPSASIQPTTTNTKYPTQDLTRAIAKNEVAALAKNKIEIEVLRIFIADRAGLTYLGGGIYENKQTVFEIIFRVTNNRDNHVAIDFFRTQVRVNDTLIDFGDYRQGPGPVGYWFIDDDFFNDVYRARKSEIGGIIVGINSPSWDQVRSITIHIPAAFDKDGAAVTEDFLFEIDPSDWGFEVLPEALEDLPRQGGVY